MPLLWEKSVGDSMEIVENIKTILETLVALGILIAVFSGFKLFKYKINSEDRRLYLENCITVRKTLGKILQYGNADLTNIETLSLAYQNALLYLDKRISDFISEVLDLVTELHVCCIQNNPVGDRRTQNAKKIEEILSALDKYNKKSIEIYRHHIVSEPLKDIKDWFAKRNPLLHLITNKPKTKP